MAIYLAIIDLKTVGRDYGVLYAHLKTIDAHQAQTSAWLIETVEPLRVLSDHLLGFLTGTTACC